MDQTLLYIQQNINQLIKNSDTSLFIQVQASIVPKYEKVPSMFTLPKEVPPMNSTTSSTTTTMASESASKSLASESASTSLASFSSKSSDGN